MSMHKSGGTKNRGRGTMQSLNSKGPKASQILAKNNLATRADAPNSKNRSGRRVKNNTSIRSKRG